ncbi:DUF2304 domain-containing protein [Candidatus Woesearchaeota archaeon]|nr:DUF2304 domain-containing protein [Candidatus Woesearchaeota archaeon]
MIGIQIVGTVFGLFMIYYSFLNYKKKEFTASEFTLWLISWFCLIVITLFPNSLNFFVENIFSMGRPLDFFIVIGFLFLITLTFYNYNLNKKNSRIIQKLVQEIAFEKEEKNKPNYK